MHKKVLITLLLFSFIILLLVHCTKKPDPVNIQNQPPETYLVNIPDVSPDTLDTTYIYHARLIFWYGTDEDGLVTRYDWAIDDTAYSANIAGSGWHSLYMDSTLATQDTIAFEAPLPDTIYSHTFYVRAVDNHSLPDPTPAHRVFSTSNIPPNTRFQSWPEDSSQRFILQDSTSLWKGINFEMVAIDSDMVFPAQFQYLWGKNHIIPDSIPDMNDPRWSTPVTEESYYFTGQNAPYEEGYHTVYVRAMDDAGSVDPCLSDTTIYISEIDTTTTPHDTTWDTLVYNQWVTLYFVIPEIYKDPTYRKLLWLNFATAGNNLFAKPFFHAVLEDSLNISIDSINYNQTSIDTLDQILFAQYSTIIWSKDDKTDWPDAPLGERQDLVADFLHVGGRMILEGSKVLNMGRAFAPNISFALEGLFPFTELHIESYENFNIGASMIDTSISPLATDTAFYNEEAVFPHLYLNENVRTYWSVARQWMLVDALELDLWGEYNGHIDILYRINHHQNNAQYERIPCAYRFTYDNSTAPGFFFFGFPLSYLDYGQGSALLRRVLIDELGE
jgi:hypothetical protein